ncbi:sulfite exporter TauE/SafE family protein [Nocardioides mangrovicus]|uniref:Probable membrane transporter protein n=1 Tax=Nocardioides mangrovicus TaxID=2478913 RepID=A0A3L8P210_9ACTN|nr:sulfite exporter TauE/SafE family protein [Nocardioides mangrovicus]RLV48863.1 sulfite exporter TauE/SafE family protein [Nocardioides mangrovicus]
MTWAWLLLAGVGAGLVGSTAGLASLVSYPALLATGIGPLAANVTNAVAMTATTAGSMWGGRRELHGQRRRLVELAAASAVGGAVGALLLLSTPASAFEAVVPWLVALGSVLLMARDPIRRWARWEGSQLRPATWWWLPLLAVVGVYGGYFGAGVGVILLAVVSLSTVEPLAVSNAVKNVGTGAANGVAAIGYAVLGPVHWGAALPMAVGALLGGALGPAAVRVLPERPLRILVGLAGLALAVHLLNAG